MWEEAAGVVGGRGADKGGLRGSVVDDGGDGRRRNWRSSRAAVALGGRKPRHLQQPTGGAILSGRDLVRRRLCREETRGGGGACAGEEEADA
jgi:hypothetical protein